MFLLDGRCVDDMMSISNWTRNTEENKMAEQSVEPIKTLVTATSGGPKDGEKIETPPGERDLQAVVMTWYGQIGVRAFRTFLQNFAWHLLAAGIGVGVAEAAMEAFAQTTGVQVPTKTRVTIDALAAAFMDSLGPTLISVIHNTLELLGVLDLGKKSRA